MKLTHRRTAGDTYPIRLIIKRKVNNLLVVVPITGATGTFNFKNVSKGKQTIEGIITDGPNGEIEFPPTAEQVDEDGSYTFNVRIVIDGKVSTSARGELILEDDL